MPKPHEIADARVQAQITRELELLTRDIEALKNRNAARGLLRSGATVRETIDRCVVVFDQARDAIYVQITWVMTNSLLPVNTDRLIAISRRHFDEILQKTDAVVRQIVELAGAPQLFDEMHTLLVRSQGRVLSEVSLHLDSEISANRTRYFRRLTGAAMNFLKNFVGQ